MSSKFAATIPALAGRCDEATEIFEELGDRSGAAWSINQQGDIARAQGDVAAARELYQCALPPFAKPETRGVPRVP